MTDLLQKDPYLRNQRSFSGKDLAELCKENDRAYIDIASKMNARTIGTFALDVPVVTGEQWYIKGSSKKQQTIRNLYLITPDFDGVIAHGLEIDDIAGYTRIYGTFTDGKNWYSLPYVDVVSVTNQIGLTITDTEIVFNEGGGAGQPVIEEGFLVLEWLSVF